jgi:hypothetical protein
MTRGCPVSKLACLRDCSTDVCALDAQRRFIGSVRELSSAVHRAARSMQRAAASLRGVNEAFGKLPKEVTGDEEPDTRTDRGPRKAR